MRTHGAVLIVAATCFGCATIMKGGSTTVVVTSPTPNAEVTVRSLAGPEVYSGPLPASIVVNKRNEYLVTVSSRGFGSRRQQLSHGFQGWTVANLLWVIPIFWGIGVAVDAMSG